MHEKRKDMTEAELQEYWQNKFCEEFEKNFGYEPVLEKKYYSEEDFILVLNYYGIKSPWM